MLPLPLTVLLRESDEGLKEDKKRESSHCKIALHGGRKVHTTSGLRTT